MRQNYSSSFTDACVACPRADPDPATGPTQDKQDFSGFDSGLFFSSSTVHTLQLLLLSFTATDVSTFERNRHLELEKSLTTDRKPTNSWSLFSFPCHSVPSCLHYIHTSSNSRNHHSSVFRACYLRS